MTISAEHRAADADRLSRSLELYRDLTVALRERLRAIRAQSDIDPDSKKAADAVDQHRKALLTIIEIEDRLGRQQRDRAGGAGAELDLDAARGEILARLARWAADG
jgi:hypothetical protein